MNCTTIRLIQALAVLAEMFPGVQVTGIQFEDGSGKKFNYVLNDATGWHYIDLTNSIN